MLATLDTFKTYLWISWSSEDALLTILLDGATSIINWYVGKTIEAASYTEIFSGNGQLSYILREYPVNSVTSFQINTWDTETAVREDVEATEYSIDTIEWVIRLYTPLVRWLSNYKVVYNAWYSTVPNDLQIACMQIASNMYNTRNSNWLKSESVAGDSISYDTNIQDSTFIILDRYKDVSF